MKKLIALLTILTIILSSCAVNKYGCVNDRDIRRFEKTKFNK